MMEAKKRKKLALEAKQLHDQFEAHPERLNSLQPIIVKSDSEVKLDQALDQLRAKLQAQTDRLNQKFPL